MMSHIQHSNRPATRLSLGGAAIFALLAGGALLGIGTGPAAAQSSWERGCAMRVDTPGPGDLLRQMNCTRQRDCQQAANAQGSTYSGAGCFMVAPSAEAAAPQAAPRSTYTRR